MGVCAVDFETFFSKKLKLSLKTMIAQQYCAHELFDPYMISVCDGTTSWSGHPKDFCWSALEGQTLVSHNRFFDNTVYDEMVKRKLAPVIAYKGWECSANLTSYICNRRALDAAVEHLFKVKLDKSARAEADNKKWPGDFSEAEREKMLDYARADAEWCWKLWDKYSSQWPELERRLSNQTIDQGRRGVKINVELLDQYVVETHAMLQKTEKLIPWITDTDDDDWEGFNIKPTSTKCIAEMCRKSGIPCPPVKSDDAEGFEEWETEYLPRHPWIRALTGWRSLNKMYKTLLTARSRLRLDDTLPFSLKYFGAQTGRWAGDAGINFQNFRKVPILCNEHGLMEQDLKRIAEYSNSETTPAWVRHEIDFRKLIIPRAGKKMILCDLAAIEPRVLAWLCGNTELLGMIRGGMSIYEAFSRANMGYTGGKMDKTSAYYKMIKIQVLGLGYGAGFKKFITIAADGGVDLCASDPEFVEETDPLTQEVMKVSGYGHTSKKIVENFRAKNPGIVGLWRHLDDMFKRSVGSDFEVELPSGRKLRYEAVRAGVRIEQDEKTKRPRRKYVFTAEVGGRRVLTYGAKICENITQATARDVFAEHLIALEDAGHTVLWSSHDESICEVDPSVTAKDIEKIMSACPSWIEGMPVAAEAQEVAHYQK